MYDWLALNKDKRNIIDDVKNKWMKLIDNPKTTEHEVHRFLENHIGLFFGNSDGTVVTKLKLSDDYTTDLVILRDNASYGFEYELIELEPPNDKVFTAQGNQSAKFSHALQQIEDWQRWIGNHREKTKKLLPSKKFNLTNEPQINYTIIIGRRKDLIEFDDKRLQKASSYGVNIRSFDYLTDKLIRNAFLNEPFYEVPSSDYVGDEVRINDGEINLLVSPFKKALTYSSWKKITSSKSFYESHSAGWNWKLFLEHTEYNEKLFSKFKE